jgi:hypothetical protein
VKRLPDVIDITFLPDDIKLADVVLIPHLGFQVLDMLSFGRRMEHGALPVLLSATSAASKRSQISTLMHERLITIFGTVK